MLPHTGKELRLLPRSASFPSFSPKCNTTPWWEKMGILARSLPGNLTIWRELLTFEIKKYIRNSGKSDYLAGKIHFFRPCTTLPQKSSPLGMILPPSKYKTPTNPSLQILFISLFFMLFFYLSIYSFFFFFLISFEFSFLFFLFFPFQNLEFFPKVEKLFPSVWGGGIIEE